MTETIWVKKNIQNRYFFAVFLLCPGSFQWPSFQHKPIKLLKSQRQELQDVSRSDCRETSLWVALLLRRTCLCTHAPQWGGVWRAASSPWGRNCAWSSHAKRSEHFFSTFNKKTVHQGPLLRWGPGRCVLLECMCLKFSVDALHSRRDRGKLRETRLSSWNLQTTFLSPPMHWEMFAFASEGPRKGPWCLSTSGAQAVFSKLSTS